MYYILIIFATILIGSDIMCIFLFKHLYDEQHKYFEQNATIQNQHKSLVQNQDNLQKNIDKISKQYKRLDLKMQNNSIPQIDSNTSIDKLTSDITKINTKTNRIKHDIQTQLQTIDIKFENYIAHHKSIDEMNFNDLDERINFVINIMKLLCMNNEKYVNFLDTYSNCVFVNHNLCYTLTDINLMFSLKYFEYIDLSGSDFSNCNSWVKTFNNVRGLTEINLNNVKLPSMISSTVGMFSDNINLKIIHMKGWNLSPQTSTNNMFKNLPNIKYIYINKQSYDVLRMNKTINSYMYNVNDECIVMN